jgi:hypothetical protein
LLGTTGVEQLSALRVGDYLMPQAALYVMMAYLLTDCPFVKMIWYVN